MSPMPPLLTPLAGGPMDVRAADPVLDHDKGMGGGGLRAIRRECGIRKSLSEEVKCFGRPHPVVG